jgi:AGZA family xanthine/uracil permease-like MFS transporter
MDSDKTSLFERRFELRARGTDVRTEVLAGVTTFLMMAPLVDIDWDIPEIAVPPFPTGAMIPLIFSIANGLAFGITAHALLKLLRGQITRTDWLLLALALLFVVRFAWLAAG